MTEISRVVTIAGRNYQVKWQNARVTTDDANDDNETIDPEELASVTVTLADNESAPVSEKQKHDAIDVAIEQAFFVSLKKLKLAVDAYRESQTAANAEAVQAALAEVKKITPNGWADMFIDNTDMRQQTPDLQVNNTDLPLSGWNDSTPEQKELLNSYRDALRLELYFNQVGDYQNVVEARTLYLANNLYTLNLEELNRLARGQTVTIRGVEYSAEEIGQMLQIELVKRKIGDRALELLRALPDNFNNDIYQTLSPYMQLQLTADERLISFQYNNTRIFRLVKRNTEGNGTTWQIERGGYGSHWTENPIMLPYLEGGHTRYHQLYIADDQGLPQVQRQRLGLDEKIKTDILSLENGSA